MDNSPNSAPLISVVLSTYNRAETLRRTLEHLARQDLPPGQFEVLVVDDGSPDDTTAVVAAMTPAMPFRLTYLRHENRGPGYTQNRGIEAARAPIVLLIADDIWLTPPAVRMHLEFHQSHPEAGHAVLGKVLQSPELNQTVFLRKWNPFRFDELEELEELPAWRFGAANLSVKRDFLLRHGMFVDQRGRGGAAAMEDLELGYRLQPHGMRLFYSKAALGHHYHLATLDQAIARWYERGLNYGEFRRYAPHPELTVYFHVLTWRTVGEYFRVLRGPNPFRGAERSFAWHLIRHFGRMVTLNGLTARWLWRPFFDLAERNPRVAALARTKMYRAFLYYQFLRGVRDAERLYGHG